MHAQCFVKVMVNMNIQQCFYIISTMNTRQRTFLLLLAAALGGQVQGFVAPRSIVSKPAVSLRSTASEIAYEPVFDFSDPSKNAVSSFDRIDDAIMGGISTSSIRAVQTETESYASWSGVCRTDGGGFCGTRTLPFQDGKPLQVSSSTTFADGFYLKLRLASDDEPERRIWKLTTRVENESRSEQLYQAEFEIPNSHSWQTIKVPFSSFQQVRGPRLVENGPPLDVSGGLFQIGMTLSKFQMAATMKTLENFRAGYFEVQLSEIGVYTNDASAASGVVETPQTLTKTEAQRKRPLALKILSPIFKRLFSEQRYDL